jgi:hypothetical protein
VGADRRVHGHSGLPCDSQQCHLQLRVLQAMPGQCPGGCLHQQLRARLRNFGWCSDWLDIPEAIHAPLAQSCRTSSLTAFGKPPEASKVTTRTNAHVPYCACSVVIRAQTAARRQPYSQWCANVQGTLCTECDPPHPRPAVCLVPGAWKPSVNRSSAIRHA